jgi:hypothetical protein
MPLPACADFTNGNACPDGDWFCEEQWCLEHPAHDGGEHTYEQHHAPEDHIGPDGEPAPEQCRCNAYVPGDPD